MIDVTIKGVLNGIVAVCPTFLVQDFGQEVMCITGQNLGTVQFT